MTETPPRSASRRRKILIALSDVLIVVAVLIVAYPFATDFLSTRDQRAMGSSLPSASAPVATPSSTADPFDWAGWQTQDRAYWEKLKSGGPFGRLVIPRIGLETVVVKGATMENLQKGPVWNEKTSLPGPTGRATVHGHRVTWLHPFKNVNRLKASDEIVFYSPYRRYTYRVRRWVIVPPEKLPAVMRDTEKPTLILTACHPWYSKRFRIVVEADLVGVARLAR